MTTQKPHAKFESFWYEKHPIFSMRCYLYHLSESFTTPGWRRTPESISHIVVREMIEKGQKWTDLHWSNSSGMLIQTPCQHLYFVGPAIRWGGVHDHKGIVMEFGYQVLDEPEIALQEAA